MGGYKLRLTYDGKITMSDNNEGKKTLNLIQSEEARWVDMRFTDTRGKEHHVTLPVEEINPKFFEEGKMFDGSSIAGWKGINESDMILMPDDNSAVVDPFFEDPTINLRCHIIDPATERGYNRDPRSIAMRAENFLRTQKLGDAALFGPEPEFFVFDDVRFDNSMSGAFYQIGSSEAAWSSGKKYQEGNLGHRPMVKGGYFPVPPVDRLHDLRAHMCDSMQQMGLSVEVHHHEVGTAGQCEIGVSANSLTLKADEVQIFKYCVHNAASIYGKTATFMPKPIVGDNGSGMHMHQSISMNGENLFSGDLYAGLSQIALYYMGGIIKHARAINAFSNASTNSYKRLVPGFEAPVILAYSASNRSASIRIPHVPSPKGRRIEARFPDATCNPYLAFSAMLMAGIDGIVNRIDPGDPADRDLYGLTPEELCESQYPTVCSSLEQALDALDADREFLCKGDVFDDDSIDAYINLKRQDVERLNMSTHPLEFEMYYSL